MAVDGAAHLTRPRVPKNSTDSGQTTYVQPPLLGLFCKVCSELLVHPDLLSIASSFGPATRRELIAATLRDLRHPPSRM